MSFQSDGKLDAVDTGFPTERHTVRVIGGSVRGHRLDSPPGDRVRPTLDRVREALFNILADTVPGSTFLDLYAGSGANGIEALSRGAERVTFVDSHPESQRCIRKNLERTRLSASGLLLRYSLPGELDKISGNFDVVFADPPYDFDDFDGLLVRIEESGVLAREGQVVLEHTSFKSPPESVGGLQCTRRRRYGKCTLSFYA